MNTQIDKLNALKLIKQYVNGWKHNNIIDIITCVSDDIVIIESHGPKYIGIKAINKWFDLWLKANSKITKWNILSFNFCTENQLAFCEWDFSCISDNQNYTLPGISVIKFINQKICHIHEYRMTNPEYLWTGTMLVSQ